MDAQRARYGDGWLSRDAANRMIEVLGRYGRMDDCRAVIDVMVANAAHADPDVVTLNTILTHCKVQNTLRTAVDILRHMEAAAPGVTPDAVTYHLLFEMAWRRRLTRVVGVIWRCASLAGMTSWRMRRRATQVLDGTSASRSARLALPRGLVDQEALQQLRLGLDEEGDNGRRRSRLVPRLLSRRRRQQVVLYPLPWLGARRPARSADARGLCKGHRPPG